MTITLTTLDIRSCPEWRRWLGTHHKSSPGIWLVFHKDHTGVESIPYEESVRAALCYGWIDSLVKRLDEDRYTRKFTPRRPISKWSDINRKRWIELKAAGLLAEAGLAATPSGKTNARRPTIPALPAYIASALKSNPEAWRFFQELAPTYQRHFVAWIHSAIRPETRRRRISEAVRLLRARKKLGLK
jgi:uncharacterized protein YdeI (YjbR/CyaY-like superfamily)